MEDPSALEAFLDSFCSIPGAKILIHGGGRAASDMSARLGLPVIMKDGRRITDAQTLEVAIMVYGGLVNKKIVALLQKRGVNALGLSGADLACIKAVRRPVGEIDYGYVGDVTQVASEAVSGLLEAGITPVFAPLSFDGGSLLNTNADSIAACVASALCGDYEVTLKYQFEKEGVLDKDGRLIASVDRNSFSALRDAGTISGGMIPKIENAVHSLESGVSRVFIGSTLIE